MYGEPAPSRLMQADYLLETGERHLMHQDWRAALTSFQEALTLYRSLRERAGEGAALCNLARTYQAAGDVEQAITYYVQALPLLNGVGDQAGEVRARAALGNLYNKIGNFREALDNLRPALPVFRALADRQAEATTMYYLAVALHGLGDYKRAGDYALPAYQLFSELNNRGLQAQVLQTMALINRDGQEPQWAITNCQQSLALFRQIGDRLGEATTLTILAGIVTRPQESLDYYGQALALYKQLGDFLPNQAAVYYNIALLLDQTGEKSQAALNFLQARDLYQRLGEISKAARTSFQAGLIYVLDLHDLPRAYDCLQLSVSLAYQANDPDVKTYEQALFPLTKELGK